MEVIHMKASSRFVIALLLLFSCVMSLFSSPAIAAENLTVRESARIQELCDPFALADENYPGTSPLIVQEDYAIYKKDRTHKGMFDLYGNAVLPPVYRDIYVLSGDILSVRKELEGGFALYRGGKQLTDFFYRNLEIDNNYIRGHRPDGSYDFYYLDGTPVKLPVISDGGEIYRLAGNHFAMLRYLISDVEGNKKYKYNLCTWDGKTVLASNVEGEIEGLINSDKIVEVPAFGMNLYFKSTGERLGEYSTFSYLSECSKFIATRGTSSLYYIFIFDENLNLLLETTAPIYPNTEFNPNKTTYGMLTNELFYVSVNDRSHRVINMKNEEILNIEEGKLFAAADHRHSVYEPIYWGFATIVDGVLSMYDATGVLLAKDEETEISSVVFVGEYAVACGKDLSTHYYNNTGFLFSLEPDQELLIQDGILLRKNESNLYAVCGLDGEPITEYRYDGYFETRGYGLLNMTRNGKSGYYLVNAAGEEVNQNPYREKIAFGNGDTLRTSYTLDGKLYGILRYIAPGASSFMDVPENAWYLDEVEYCYEKGLFSGTAVGKFSPEDSMTRAMLVTVLWRLEGEPAAQKSGEFIDVMPGLWYSQAVQWAAENGIVNGVGKGEFDPDGEITREQMATVIYRYGKWKGYDLEDSVDLGKFPDASSVSSYAVEAISWANAAGIINGSNEGGTLYLQPQGKATRAQVAAILMRFIENILN